MISHFTPFRAPFAASYLEPFVGEDVVKLHFDLTRGYIERANRLLGAKRRGKPVNEGRLTFEVNGARLHQIWWQNLAPFIPGRKQTRIPGQILKAFGGNARTLKKELLDAALALEGSGWVALVWDQRKGYASVRTVQNHSFKWRSYSPLLLIDIWEHAYLLDYEGDRRAYFDAIWRLVDWKAVLGRLP